VLHVEQAVTTDVLIGFEIVQPPGQLVIVSVVAELTV